MGIKVRPLPKPKPLPQWDGTRNMSTDEQEARSLVYSPGTFQVRRLRSGRWAIFEGHVYQLTVANGIELVNWLNKRSDHASNQQRFTFG